MILLIDNYDSFTYNLKDYFGQLGEECIVVRNDELTIDEVAKLHFDKIVLSPGPERPETAGILNQVILRFHTTYPILGICLGHQAIGEFFGLKLTKAQLPMHGKVSKVKHNNDGIFSNIPNPVNVCRYHSLVLKEVKNAPLKIISEAYNGEIMALEHLSLPIFGVQFHPEAILSENGLDILRNWLNLVKAKSVGI